MNCALIENDLVVNIIWLSERHIKSFPNAIPTNGKPIKIGDTYIDGKFYRDGEEVLSSLEKALQTISEYEKALAEIEAALGV